MPSIYQLKPAFQNLLRPSVRVLASMGITANQVTLTALFISLAAGILVFVFNESNWPLLMIPLTLFLRMALNAIDGMLAREFAMKSKLGALLNELGDVLSDTFLYLPLATVPGFPAALIIIAVLLSIISEMAGVLSLQIGGQRRYDGPMGKSDRAFVFGTLTLAVGLGVQPGVWLTLILIAILVLLAATIINRAQSALREAG